MTELRLIPALDVLPEQVMAFREEFLASGERSINGSRGLHNYDNYADWRNLVERCSEPGNDLIGVETSTWFAMCGAQPVGCIELRHSLTPSLEQIGGHIGYSVSPSHRRKGYAKTMLRLAVEQARTSGIDRLLLTVDIDNIASIRTIESCGGVAGQDIYSLGDEQYYKYWIELK